jgi:hypothetical protein
MELEESYVERLQFYSRLHSLTLHNIHNIPGNFILAFVEALENEEPFTSLTMLDIRFLWPVECSVSHVEFIQHCTAKRPHLSIVTNVESYQEFMESWRAILPEGVMDFPLNP